MNVCQREVSVCLWEWRGKSQLQALPLGCDLHPLWQLCVCVHAHAHMWNTCTRMFQPQTAP